MKIAPSIDRIDVKKGYFLGNMQIITHGENCAKDKGVSIDLFNKNGKFIKKRLGPLSETSTQKRVCGELVEQALTTIWTVEGLIPAPLV